MGFRISGIAELCNGSTADSGSVCLGSNPSSATKMIEKSVGGHFFVKIFGYIKKK